MKVISEDRYYRLMNNMPIDDLGKLRKAWYSCFKYKLKDLCPHYNDRVAKSLFEDFDMSNWKALHQENTKYADYTKDQLLEEFKSECSYISDRCNYDRLFRTHWIYKRIKEDE